MPRRRVASAPGLWEHGGVSTALELARWQFALTTLYHFTFVPLTMGLAPLLAVMQTIWYRTADERWLRLTRFFAVLFVINFAIGAATGIVQEFQFGMNWSGFSRYVGDVFGAPLAIEGIGAFMLESTFIGLWIFGRDLLSRRAHLACVYVVWFGTWLSAYFIIAANSWMQHPVGYTINATTGRAQATDVWAIFFQRLTIMAFVHVIFAGLMTGGFVVLGVACWHLLRGRNIELFRRAATLAIFVVLPVSVIQLGWGSELGVAMTDVQPMKIAASEALWNSAKPAPFSLFQIGGFSASDPTPAFSIEVPGLLSFLATNSFTSEVEGINQVQAQEQATHGPGNYVPDVRLAYWSMRVMAYLGTLSLMLAIWGGILVRRKRLLEARWFQRAALAGIALPFLANFAGWILTETARQPWIVYGLQRTAAGVSTTSSTAMVGASLGVFVGLYGVLAIVDFWLMRRYARVDPPEIDDAPTGGAPRPAPQY
jgi:cytochrome bd ubiquinol oxidase subunit I